jgi:hypothetical protein
VKAKRKKYKLISLLYAPYKYAQMDISSLQPLKKERL